MKWKSDSGQTVCTIDGAETAEAATDQVIDIAKKCGWRPARWWEFWKHRQQAARLVDVVPVDVVPERKPFNAVSWDTCANWEESQNQKP